MKELLKWFQQNPNKEVSTHELGTIGLKHLRKGAWHLYNQATLERNARSLVEEGKLESRHQGGYVLFKLAEAGKKKATQWRIEERNGIKIAVMI